MSRAVPDEIAPPPTQVERLVELGDVHAALQLVDTIEPTVLQVWEMCCLSRCLCR